MDGVKHFIMDEDNDTHTMRGSRLDSKSKLSHVETRLSSTVVV